MYKRQALEVKKAKVPILFIHGDADTFVPCSMCFEIYENCASKKNMLIVHGAGHVEAFYKEQVLYEQKLTEFLETAGEAWAPAGKSIDVYKRQDVGGGVLGWGEFLFVKVVS